MGKLQLHPLALVMLTAPQLLRGDAIRRHCTVGASRVNRKLTVQKV